MPYNILIVDDSATTRAIIQRTLTLTGVDLGEVFQAGNGVQALEVLESQSVDIVLTDLNMPTMGGSDLIDAMDRSPKFCKVPVVIISTEGSKPRLQQIVRPLVAGILRKPFTAEQLKTTLCRITGNKAI